MARRKARHDALRHRVGERVDELVGERHPHYWPALDRGAVPASVLFLNCAGKARSNGMKVTSMERLTGPGPSRLIVRLVGRCHSTASSGVLCR